MKQKTRRMLSLLLVLAMCMGVMSPYAWAAEVEEVEPEEYVSAVEPEEYVSEAEPEEAAEPEVDAEEVLSDAEDALKAEVMTEEEEPNEADVSDEVDATAPAEEASDETLEEGTIGESVTEQVMGTVVDSGTCGDDVTWSLTGAEGAYTLTIKGNGPMKDYNTDPMQQQDPPPWCGRTDIKAIIVEPGITHIGDEAFEYLEAAESVSLPDGIISIGGGAFNYCQSLQEIVLPSSVRELGGSVFYACTSLKRMTIPDGVKLLENGSFGDCYALESVTIPNSVTQIKQAFMDCTSLKSILLPPNITNIDYCCFYGCESLEEIKIPDNVERIEDQAFQYCTSLKKINIGKNVAEIGDGVFDDCDSLVDISLSAENPYFSSEQGVLFNNDFSELKIYPISKMNVSYTVRDSVKTIANGAFSGNNYIQKVVLPESVHTIGRSAFSWCKALKSINIPSGITVIDEYTFAHCFQLNQITLPERLTRIGDNAFQSCIKLSKITIPHLVEFIGEHAFSACRSMTEVEFLSRNFYIRGANVIPSNALIKGYSNSDSEKYAIAYGRSFLDLESQQKKDYQANNQRYIDMLPASGITASGPVAIGNKHSRSSDGRFSGYDGNIAFERPENTTEYKEILAKVRELTQGSDDRYEHAKSIANWVSFYIDYRYAIWTDSDVESIFDVWRREFGNCMSYSMLLNYMLYLDGIPSLTLSSADHQWSGALIDGRWVMIDATNNWFDFDPNQADDIDWISFADGPLMVVIDDMLSVSLGGISKSYLQTMNLRTVTIPAYINKCYENVFGNIPDGVTITGKLGTDSYHYVKNRYPCVAERNGCYYSYSDGHSWDDGVATKPATVSEEGVKTFTCTRCNATRTEAIPKLSKVTLKAENVTVANGTFVYNGKAQQPAVTVKYGGKQLVQDTDYTVSYSNNTNAGTATVIIKGIGNYQGTKKETFTIVKAVPKMTFESTNLVKLITDQAFTNALNMETDGIVTFKSSNEKVATVDSEKGIVVLSGIGRTTISVMSSEGTNYTAGSCSYELEVTPVSIKKASVGGVSLSYGYSGKAYTPALTVKVNGVTIKKDTDYTVKYADNIKPGTAKITITGKGNYTGTRIKTFEIVDCVSSLVSGKTYQLIPKNNSKTAVCSYSGKMVNNTKVYITDRSNSEAMKFKAVKNSDGTWKFINAKCELALAVQQNSSEVGKGTVLYDQTTKKAQNWKLSKRSDNSFAIMNAVTGYSIAMSDASAVKGTTLSMAVTASSGLQRFYIAETMAVSTPFDGTNGVKASKDKKFALNIASSSKSDGANVNLYSYSNTNAKKFKVIYSGGGYYRLVNVNSGLCLTVKGNVKTDGANVVQSSWSAADGQRWKITKNSDGTVTITNALGTVLHLNGNKTVNGTNVLAKKAASTKAQMWYLN